MNIRWLILFSAVAEEGSFTRAATRLNVAQPWVSAQIRKLEFELGIDLLERTKSGIALTNEGRALLPFATQVAEGSRRFRDLARTMGDVRSKIVRLGSHLPIVELGRLGGLHNEYQRRYANFSIDIERGDTPALLDALEQGLVDCAVCLGPVEDGDGRYDILTIARTQPYLLMRRDAAIDADRLEGVVVGTPDVATQPAFLEPLLASLRSAGAGLRLVPEAGRQAMEHYVRQRHGPVLMVEGASTNYDRDGELVAHEMDADPAVILLIRVAAREPGRAAMRYWNLLAADFTTA